MKPLEILVACEESQEVTEAFIDLGHNAMSCDLNYVGAKGLPHYKGDVLEIINSKKFDALIGFTPCDFLAVSGAQWFYHPEDRHLPVKERRAHPLYPNRAEDRDSALEFVCVLMNAPIYFKAFENPVGAISTRISSNGGGYYVMKQADGKKGLKPTQIIQPYMFGHEATKTTCIWTQNLPKLLPTNIVGKGERSITKSGKSLPKWYNIPPGPDRKKTRSRTFTGIAKAMAHQWSEYMTAHNRAAAVQDEAMAEQLGQLQTDQYKLF